MNKKKSAKKFNNGGYVRHSFNKKNNTSQLKKYNQRAVSDFGAIGDNLLVLNTDDLIIDALDWTNDLSDIDDGVSQHSHNNEKFSEIINIVINRAFAGQPLGFQIGSITNDKNDNDNNIENGNENFLKVFAVKQITAMPAAGANLKIGDVILSINGVEIEGMTHDYVVNLLRSTSKNLDVKLKIKRLVDKNKTDKKKTEEFEKIICVTLNKPQNKSLGLSLAKRMGFEGVFIRNIAQDSLINQQGNKKLQVGDKIWSINGEQVDNESSANIVHRLTHIDGILDICVKRLTLITK